MPREEKFPHDSRLTVRRSGAWSPLHPEAWVTNGPHAVGITLANMRRYAAWLCEMADKIERANIAEMETADATPAP